MMDNAIERPLDRRLLLRGGAVLAGAAGITVIGNALKPATAQAADGQFAVVGQPNTSESSTRFTIDGENGGEDAALSLINVSGPALLLPPVGDGYSGSLRLGEIANTGRGPEIGVQYGFVVEGGVATQTTWLATGLDLDQIPFVLPIPPQRLLDTRTEEGRERVKSTSPDAFDADFRVKANSWIDVAIIEANYVGLEGVFTNVTVTGPTSSGYVTAYPPGPKPSSSTLNFVKGQTIANAAFVLSGVAQEDDGWYVIRLFTTAPAHLVLDFSGVTVRGIAGTSTPRAGRASQRNAVKAHRMKRVFQ